MIEFNSFLNRLKKISFFLFLIPLIAIIFSLLINNLLASFFQFGNASIFLSKNFNFKPIECNKINDDCFEYFYLNYRIKQTDNLYNCNQNDVKTFLTYGNKIYDYQSFRNKIFLTNLYDQNKLQKIEFFKSKEINHACIKNSKFFWIHKNVPAFTDFLYLLKLSPNVSIGTSTAVNPIFYGETSISNIVKRKPIRFFFKPLMYISAILMLLYWYHNNKVARKIQNSNKNFSFFYYGFLSAIFLFFHVLFLGSEIDNELFKKIRRLIIVLFIIFEIVSQALLVFNLKKNIELYKNIISKKILSLKYILISFMILVSILIVLILTFFDLSSSFDYFLEWNYFIILLFFYLLSSLLWKTNFIR